MWASLISQPGGFQKLEEAVGDNPKFKRQMTDALGYLHVKDDVAEELVASILRSLDSNSACREGTSAEARGRIEALLEDNCLVCSLKVCAELGRSGLPTRLWDRPPNIACPPRLRAVERLDDPDVAELWRYVGTNTPCVLENAFASMAAMKNFRDDAYLADLCGARPVRLRANVYPDADGRLIFIDGGAEDGRFDGYIERCAAARERGDTPKEYAGKIELRKCLPEMADALDADATDPRRKYGACFGDLTAEGEFMYFGGGNNATKTHFDPFDNLMLVFDGTKKLWLWPPSDHERMYPWPFPSFSHSGVPSFRRQDDPSLERFPKFRDSAFVEVDLKAGDCLYLPAFWYHCVAGGPDRNMIVNWWFHLSGAKRDTSTALVAPGLGPAISLAIPTRREMRVQGRGAVVREGPALDTAEVTTLPRDSMIVLSPNPAVRVGDRDRLQIVEPAVGWLSRVAVTAAGPPRPVPRPAPVKAPPPPTEKELLELLKPSWLQQAAPAPRVAAPRTDAGGVGLGLSPKPTWAKPLPA